MQSANLPDDEPERLAALRNYKILDTLPERTFDEITQLASSICDTPIATISLIDENRQWFKSKIGLTASETPRDVAFCAHAILNPDDVFVVEDATQDARFADNPAVTGEPHVRFYAGWPLREPKGHALGTLCVIDTTPRTLTPVQREALRVLSIQVIQALELRSAQEQTDTIHMQLSDIESRHQQLIAADQERDDLMQKLLHSNTELERFAYVASHDMQEPLRMIGNFSELLGNEYADKLDSDGREYIAQITRSARRMQDMISDLLDYARVGHELPNFVSVLMNDELKRVIENLSLHIKDYDATVTSDPLPDIKGNPVQIMRLLQNLIGNGLKYQEAGTKPRVHVGVEEAGDSWAFFVQDNGIGIAPEHLEKIFAPFRRLHTWEEYTGTGIGLAVCRKIVQNHGGRIWITSEEGKGSTVHFTIPKTKPE